MSMVERGFARMHGCQLGSESPHEYSPYQADSFEDWTEGRFDRDTGSAPSPSREYERLWARKYLYRSAPGFSADLAVDSFGLVSRYDDIWKRV